MTAVFKYPADRSRVAVFAGIFAIDLTVYFLVDRPVWLLAYFVVGILPKGAACAFNHHHQHLQTFKVPLLNRALEVMYALQTGVSSHTWVLHHSVGHHLNYLDQDRDESRWMRKNRSIMGQIEYSFMTSITSYWRAWKVGKKYPKYRRVFLLMGLLTASLIGVLVWNRPLSGLTIFVLAPAFSLFGTAWATYAHHSKRSTDSHFVASTNVMQPLYNFVTGNLGYHTAHHYRPGVHWSKLREIHAKIADQIPADAYVDPGWPWSMFGSGTARTSGVKA
jgi:fatty acid desaturase